jgi:hypothetical protein
VMSSALAFFREQCYSAWLSGFVRLFLSILSVFIVRLYFCVACEFDNVPCVHCVECGQLVRGNRVVNGVGRVFGLWSFTVR